MSKVIIVPSVLHFMGEQVMGINGTAGPTPSYVTPPSPTATITINGNTIFLPITMPQTPPITSSMLYDPMREMLDWYGISEHSSRVMTINSPDIFHKFWGMSEFSAMIDDTVMKRVLIQKQTYGWKMVFECSEDVFLVNCKIQNARRGVKFRIWLEVPDLTPVGKVDFISKQNRKQLEMEYRGYCDSLMTGRHEISHGNDSIYVEIQDDAEATQFKLRWLCS